MKEVQVRWPHRPWNRAIPSNPATRKYSIEMVADIHTEVRRTLGCSWESVDTTWRCTASLQCGCPKPCQYCISWSLDLKACEITWSQSPSLFSMGISKITCVWDPSRNVHGISCQNCSCLWYYSKHIGDICQGAARILYVDVIFALRLVAVNLSNCKMQNDTLIMSMYCICR